MVVGHHDIVMVDQVVGHHDIVMVDQVVGHHDIVMVDQVVGHHDIMVTKVEATVITDMFVVGPCDIVT